MNVFIWKSNILNLDAWKQVNGKQLTWRFPWSNLMRYWECNLSASSPRNTTASLAGKNLQNHKSHGNGYRYKKRGSISSNCFKMAITSSEMHIFNQHSHTTGNCCLICIVGYKRVQLEVGLTRLTLIFHCTFGRWYLSGVTNQCCRTSITCSYTSVFIYTFKMCQMTRMHCISASCRSCSSSFTRPGNGKSSTWHV